jgi:hypothetical protein
MQHKHSDEEHADAEAVEVLSLRAFLTLYWYKSTNTGKPHAGDPRRGAASAATNARRESSGLLRLFN